ncbi:hypothetical protein Q9189_003159 [Teloschistes chrysophthalmus]
MEGITAAASIIAIVQISEEVGKLCGTYIRGVRHAQKEIERLQTKALALHAVLKRLENEPHTSIDGKVIKSCCDELSSIKERLQPRKKQVAMKRFGLRALKWPFTSKEVDLQVQALEQYLALFSTSLQLDIFSKITDAEQKRLLDTLAYVGDALFNSYENDRKHRMCLKNTRIQILQEIMDWVADSSSHAIFWLKGLAGSGKSTIAATVASGLRAKFMPLATYFFRRGHGDLAHARKLIPTLVRQLSQCSASYQQQVLSAVEDEPGLGQSASLRDQYEKLLIRPLRRMAPLPVNHDPLCIVMDALDECDEQHDLRTLLRLLAGTDDIPTLRLKILVTSRPELLIRHGFERMSTIFHRDLALQDVPRAVVNTDIMTFLKHELKEVQYDFQLPADWPTPDDMNTLSRKAGGLFIFAATSCRYIGGSPHAKPQERLRQVCASVATNKLMTNELDQMYTIVLQNSIKGSYTEEEREAAGASFGYVVGCMILLFDPLPVAELFRLLQDPHIDSKEELEGVLRTLHAVIDIPRDTGCPVQILHLSFHDYLLGSNRCLDQLFRIDEKKTHRILAGNCLRLLKSTLYRNMCGLPSPGTLQEEVDPLTVKKTLPPGVEYACRRWVEHALQGESVVADNDDVYEFLQRHFLHWLELHFLPDGKLLATLCHSVHKLDHGVSQLDLWDVQTGNCQSHLKPSIADLLMENISPDGNLVSQLTNDGTLMLWDIARQEYRFTIEPGPNSVSTTTEFSSDGQSLALGFRNGDLWLLNTQKGNQQHRLNGHSAEIEDLTFSPDNKLMVSIAKDEPTRVWDIRTGSQLVTKQVLAVKAAFSPDSKLLALVADKTVYVWDIVLSECRFEREFGYHYYDKFAPLNFSPDGKLLALPGPEVSTIQLVDALTGSWRSTFNGVCHAFLSDSEMLATGLGGAKGYRICLWNVQSQECVSVLGSHQYRAHAIRFSPDGRYLALGDRGGIVRLWDLQKAGSLPGPEVESNNSLGRIEVSFLPNGALVASTHSGKVRIYDSDTGKCRFEYKGHSVSLSPDGFTVVSMSNDVIRLLDTEIGYERCFQGGQLPVISPDGQQAAFVSKDDSIHIWDIQDSTSLFIFKGHSQEISSLIFSPNGKLLASHSKRDKNVRLWNTGTGNSVFTFPSYIPKGSISEDSISEDSISEDNISEDNISEDNISEDSISDDLGVIMAFAPSSELLVIACSKRPQLWDVLAGCHRFEFNGFVRAHDIDNIVFSPDSRFVAFVTYTSGHEVLLWDLNIGQHVLTISCSSWISRAEFVAGIDALFVDGQAHKIGSRELSRAQIAHHSRHISDLQMDESCNWITKSSEKVLWLPPERRGFRYAVWRNKIAIFSYSGRLTLLTFEGEPDAQGRDHEKADDSN